MLLVESACQEVAARVVDASRSSGNVLNPSASAGQDSGNNPGKVGQVPSRGNLNFPGTGACQPPDGLPRSPPWTNSRRSFVCKMRSISALE